jgi:hypothetical protein
MLLTAAKPSAISRRWPGWITVLHRQLAQSPSHYSPERNNSDQAVLDTEINMQDILWILVTVAFFALSIGYVHFCDRVK